MQRLVVQTFPFMAEMEALLFHTAVQKLDKDYLQK
jgi:hypothetical protein